MVLDDVDVGQLGRLVRAGNRSIAEESQSAAVRTGASVAAFPKMQPSLDCNSFLRGGGGKQSEGRRRRQVRSRRRQRRRSEGDGRSGLSRSSHALCLVAAWQRGHPVGGTSGAGVGF